MKVTAWRIVKTQYAETAFSGEGAKRFGGRWNSVGTRVVYASGSAALAALEMLVHLNRDDHLKRYSLIPVWFEDALVETDSALPDHWQATSPPPNVQAIGDRWVIEARSAVIRLPSAIIPGESNYLINPRHSDFQKIEIGRPEAFSFDRRLFQTR